MLKLYTHAIQNAQQRLYVRNFGVVFSSASGENKNDMCYLLLGFFHILDFWGANHKTIRPAEILVWAVVIYFCPHMYFYIIYGTRILRVGIRFSKPWLRLQLFLFSRGLPGVVPPLPQV